MLNGFLTKIELSITRPAGPNSALRLAQGFWFLSSVFPKTRVVKPVFWDLKGKGMNRRAESSFHLCGAATVIASLWTVDDQATGLLMRSFCTHLKHGAGKAEALRIAQSETRRQYPNPYYWAAFVLTGDGGPAPRSNSASQSPKSAHR
jgi:hypothetical protein